MHRTERIGIARRNPGIIIQINSFYLFRLGRFQRLVNVFGEEQEVQMPEQETYPKGHWMGVGIGIGIGFGIPIGIVMGILMDNITLGISLGPGMGAGIGSCIGAVLEAKHKDQIRPLTEGEKRTRKILTILGVSVLFLGILFFVFMLRYR